MMNLPMLIVITQVHFLFHLPEKGRGVYQKANFPMRWTGNFDELTNEKDI